MEHKNVLGFCCNKKIQLTPLGRRPLPRLPLIYYQAAPVSLDSHFAWTYLRTSLTLGVLPFFYFVYLSHIKKLRTFGLSSDFYLRHVVSRVGITWCHVVS